MVLFCLTKMRARCQNHIYEFQIVFFNFTSLLIDYLLRIYVNFINVDFAEVISTVDVKLISHSLTTYQIIDSMRKLLNFAASDPIGRPFAEFDCVDGSDSIEVVCLADESAAQ